MASAESSYHSTQQPTYRVTAQAVHQPIPTIDESPNQLSTLSTPIGGNGEAPSVGPPAFSPFTLHEVPRYPLSSSQISSPKSKSQSIPVVAQAAQPEAVTTTWATLPRTSPPSKPSDRTSPDPDIEEDELNSSMPPEGLADVVGEDSISSPPDSPPLQSAPSAKPVTPPRTRSSLRLSVPPPSFTPSKNVMTAAASPAKKTPQPISTFSPSNITSTKRSTTAKRVGTSPSPTRRLPKARSPFKRTTSTKSRQSVDDERDSFEDNFRPRPRQLIEQMIAKSSESKTRLTNTNGQAVWNAKNTAVDMPVGHAQAEPERTDGEPDAVARVASPPPSSPKVDPPPQPSSSSHSAGGNDTPLPGGQSRHFADLDSSAPQPSPASSLHLATVSTQNYGYEEEFSQATQFAATQAVSHTSEREGQAIESEHSSSPLFTPDTTSFLSNNRVPAHRQLSRTGSRAATSIHEDAPPTRPSEAGSFVSNGTGTGNSRVSSNRQLQRVNRRAEDSQPPKRLGMTHVSKSAPINQASRKSSDESNRNRTIAAPERAPPAFEPTQTDGPLQPSLNVVEADTFVDAAPPSPPHDPVRSSRPAQNAPLSSSPIFEAVVHPVSVSSPVHPLLSSPPPTPISNVDAPSRPIPRQSEIPHAPHSNTVNDGLQPTSVEKTLPLPAPSKPVTPKKYIGKRRTRRSTTAQGGSEKGPSEEPVPPKAKRAKIVTKESAELSDDSGTTVEDPEDKTWRPPAQPTISKPGKPLRNGTRGLSTSAKASPAPRVVPTVAPSKRQSEKSSHVDTASSHRSTPLPPAVSVDPLTPPFRVLGLWSHSSKYYVGTVTDVDASGEKPYHVVFDDGYKDKVARGNLRILAIRKGDKIRAQDGHPSTGTLVVARDMEAGDEKIQVEFEHKDPFVALRQVYMTSQTIKAQFEDRKLDQLLTSVGLPRDGFAGKVFLVTSNSKAVKQNEICRKIEKYGGKVAKSWAELFDRSNDGFHSDLIATNVPFLVVEGAEGMKPKMVAMLAAGVPCLSSEYIEDAISRSADWREYLIAPGKPIDRQFYASQIIDLNWGEDTWEPKTARNPRQPLKGKHFAFLRPRSTTGTFPDVKALVPFCLHALGASSLKQVDNGNEVNIDEYDILIVEDRDPSQPIPKAWMSSRKLANFIWLKQCILVGGALPLALMKEGGRSR